jgi:hypothetical protein
LNISRPLHTSRQQKRSADAGAIAVALERPSVIISEMRLLVCYAFNCGLNELKASLNKEATFSKHSFSYQLANCLISVQLSPF